MRDSEHLIKLIKNKFINRDNMLSATYPPSSKHLLTDLDDFVPFFLYYGELEFVQDQIKQAMNIVNSTGLILSGNRIVSYQNNEFIEGIARYYKLSSDSSVKPILDNAMNGVKFYLSKNNVIIAYYQFSSHKSSSISVPISGGLIETIIENSDLYPDISEIAYNTLDMWISNELFQKYGLFISKYNIQSKLWNKIYPLTAIPLSLKIQNRIGTNFYLNGDWNNIIFNLPIGLKVQTAKDNTNMVFALIEAYRRTKKIKYKNAVIWWIENFIKKMIINRKVFRFYQLHGKPKLIDLSHVHPVLDIFCDAYMFVSNDESFIRIAMDIVETCFRDIQWKMGLFPKVANGNINHLDIQTDFIVSLRRLYELSGIERYKEKANELFQSVLKHHYTANGFVTSVSQNGKIKNTKIEPKYNALLLKAFILAEDQAFNIYGSDSNYKLMRDR